MNVVTLLNEKGGVGKTTLSLHFSAGAALHDLRVLLIDSDTQGQCATLLGIAKSAGLPKLLVAGASWKSVLVEPDFARWGGRAGTVGRLLLLPGNIETRMTPMRIDNLLILRERLHELDGLIDLVVIDTSPTPTLLQPVITLASDAVIYPTRPNLLSEDGLAESVGHMREQEAVRAQYGLPPLVMLGVVPNHYRDTLAHRNGIEHLEKFFGDALVWRPLPLRTIWEDREGAQQTLFAYAPKHEAALEMMALVERMLSALKLNVEHGNGVQA